MTCSGKRKNKLRCGSTVYRCKKCGATGCSIPECSSRGSKSGSCLTCGGTQFAQA